MDDQDTASLDLFNLKEIFGPNPDRWDDAYQEGHLPQEAYLRLYASRAPRTTHPVPQPVTVVHPAPIDTPAPVASTTEATPDGKELVPRPGVLPPEFYDGCPELEHIRTEAHQAGRSATTTTLGVLTLIASMADVRLRIPGYVGGEQSLSLYACAVAPSGGGKSSGMSIAKKLVEWDHEREGDYLMNEPSTGQGMIEAHFTVEPDPSNPKGPPVKTQTGFNIHWSFDEGQTFIARLQDKGSTLGYTIRSGWNGNPMGQANANVQFRRKLDALSYQWGFMVVIQDAFVDALVNETDGGTAQRFVWCSTEDPDILHPSLRERRTDIGVRPLGWTHPSLDRPSGLQAPRTDGAVLIHYPAEFIDEMRDWDYKKTMQPGSVDPIDSHLYLNMMKMMANLALLRGRIKVNEDDVRRVRLAFDTVSRPVARRLATNLRHDKAKKEQEVAEKAVRIDEARHAATEDKMRARIVQVVTDNSHRGADTLWSELSKCGISRHKKTLGEERYLGIFEELEEAKIVVRVRTTPEGNPVYNVP